MQGNPASFDAIGSRLGFTITHNDSRHLKLTWHGPRFPAYLCLGIALLLLLVSVPIVEAIRLRGFVGPAASLWYFPPMNAVLFLIAGYLLTLKRTIVFNTDTRSVTFTSRSLFTRLLISAEYREIACVRLGFDEVYQGFAVAGSSAAEKFSVPSLRLMLTNGESLLLDRGSRGRLKDLGARISERLQKPLEIDPAAVARTVAKQHEVPG